jgi:hypothetical protein
MILRLHDNAGIKSLQFVILPRQKEIVNRCEKQIGDGLTGLSARGQFQQVVIASNPGRKKLI